MISVPRTCITIAGLCLSLMADSASAAESNYPNRPVRLIAPVAPGGIIDLLARTIGAGLGDALGQQFVVDNRPGANGIIGTDLAAKATPDGYTLLIVPGGHAINPSLYKKLPYDTLRDLARVAMIGHSPYVLAASSKLGVKDVAGLIALAKTRPGKISYASSGIGNVTHLAAELFNMTAGVKLEHVPYKGTGQFLPDLFSGAVPVTIMSFSSAHRYSQTGNLLLLGIASPRRNALLPNLPTLAESGLPGYEVTGWYGFVIAAASPKPVIDQLNGAVRALLHQPAMLKTITEQGLEVVDWTPAQFDAHVRTDMAKWRKVIGQLGLPPQ